MPLPITHKDWDIDIRKLNSSGETGEALDTTQAALASRKVAEQIETMLFTGTSSFSYGGGVIYGLMDEPNINTGSLIAHWNDSAATGATVLADTLAMKQASLDAKHYGPWEMFIPSNFETAVDDNYVVNYPGSRRKRLMEITNLVDIKVADKLTDDNIIFVQLTPDVVRMVEGLPLTNVEWEGQGGMIFNFKVMTINIPQVRADKSGNSGVVRYS